MDSAPGIECRSGSLGQGLSFGLGMALGYKKQGRPNQVYVMVGDGELQEGQISGASYPAKPFALINPAVGLQFFNRKETTRAKTL